MKTMKIREFRKSDTNAVVDIHLRAFEGFFLTFLGPSFLSVLYNATHEDKTGIMIVLEEDGIIVGFVCGTTNANGFYKHLLTRHILKFFLASLDGFFRRPLILPKLLTAFKTPHRPLPKQNCSTLMSLAVDPNYQNRGIGRKLVSSFVDNARKNKCEYVNLTTDTIDNDHVNKFYKNLGFEIINTLKTSQGRLMNEYILKIG